MKARTLMRIAMTAMKKTATMMRRGSMGLVRVHAVALTPASLSRLRLSCRIGTAKCVTMTEYFTILMIFILYTILLTEYSTNLINTNNMIFHSLRSGSAVKSESVSSNRASWTLRIQKISKSVCFVSENGKRLVVSCLLGTKCSVSSLLRATPDTRKLRRRRRRRRETMRWVMCVFKSPVFFGINFASL